MTDGPRGEASTCPGCGHPGHGATQCHAWSGERFPVETEHGEAEMLCSSRCLCGTPREAERQAALRRAFEDGLRDNYSVKLFVRRHPGVAVPAEVSNLSWRGGGTLCLEYGLDMPVPVVDLRVDDRGVGAVLSFDRTPRETHVPWGAVAAVVSGEPPARVARPGRHLRAV